MGALRWLGVGQFSVRLAVGGLHAGDMFTSP